MAKIQVDDEKCISCGDCVVACSSGLFVAKSEKIRVLDEEYCNLCGHCVALCPTEAITIQEIDQREFPALPGGLIVPPETLATFLRSRRSCKVFAEKEVPRQVLEK